MRLEWIYHFSSFFDLLEAIFLFLEMIELFVGLNPLIDKYKRDFYNSQQKKIANPFKVYVHYMMYLYYVVISLMKILEIQNKKFIKEKLFKFLI